MKNEDITLNESEIINMEKTICQRQTDNKTDKSKENKKQNSRKKKHISMI